MCECECVCVCVLAVSLFGFLNTKTNSPQTLNNHNSTELSSKAQGKCHTQYTSQIRMQQVGWSGSKDLPAASSTLPSQTFREN